MSYIKRVPCKKYFEKSSSSNKQEPEIRTSLSATKFAPFRRASDTTSESGSDDFKMEMAEDVSSSFSRSSSDSYTTFGVNSRYQCINNLKDLSEMTHLNEEFDAEQQQQQQQQQTTNANETLDDFRSRLNSRRKFKTRYQDSQDDDKTDNSCDSTTSKAHEEILRNANLLRQEQVVGDDSKNGFNAKKVYHREIHSYKQISGNNNNKIAQRNEIQENEETILMKEFDAILKLEESKLTDYSDDVFQPSIPSVSINSIPNTTPKTIARSSTENFLVKSANDDTKHTKASASPRFRRKTHVLKAASSIPSLIFSNKNVKQKTSVSNSSYDQQYGQNQDKFDNNLLKKNSIDEDVFQISVTKARRSPLRILGNLVDDKIFRGRWSTAKRAKSTDEITWALANEENNIQNELPARGGSTKQNRKKSFGGFLAANTDSNNNFFNKKQYKSLSDKFKNTSDSNSNDSFSVNQNYNTSKNKSKFIEIRKPSNTFSQILTVSDSSLASSVNDGHHYQNVPKTRQTIPNNEIRAETLAEIEAFEKMLETHLQD